MGSGFAIETLQEALSELASDDLHVLLGPALCERALEINRLRQALDAEFTRTVGVLDRTRAYETVRGGFLSGAAFLRHRCRLAPNAAAEQVRVARRLVQLPAVADAFASGDIGFPHAAAITRSADEVGIEPVQAFEQELVAVAREEDPQRLRRVTSYLRHCVDPDGALAEVDRQHERRKLWLSQTDDMYYLQRVLDAEDGGFLWAALEAAEGEPVPGDRRSAPQRRADAFMDLVRERSSARASLVVTVPAEALRGEPGALPGELQTGGLLAPESVRRLACDCSMSVVVVDASGDPLSVSRQQRTIPAPMRRALLVRDRTCRFRGCGRPARWCDGHHLKWVEHGGETTLPNLVLACRLHHRMLHQRRLTLVRAGDGWWDPVPMSANSP